jgi:hypothetical protein
MAAPGVTQQGLNAYAPHTLFTNTDDTSCQCRFLLN